MKKSTQKTFTEIMDLSAEIGFQISDAIQALKHIHDASLREQLVITLVDTIDAIASKINKLAYENI